MSDELFAPLPDNWELTTLGDVCARGGGFIQTGPFGSQLHASDYVRVGVPSIMPVNIGDNRVLRDGIAYIREEDAERLSRHRVRTGDIIYSRRGDVERRALIRSAEEGWFCGTGCLLVRLGNGRINSAYASYYLGHPSVREWIVRHAVGATMPNLNTSIMSAVPFLVPPLHEQEDIVTVLGSLDDKIECNRRMNRTLEAMARAIFQSWFVDFDPVRAKMDRRAPAGMDTATAALFPDHFEDSELGKIPAGWKLSLLPEVIAVNPPRSLPRGTVAPYLDMGNMPTDSARALDWCNREFGSGMRFCNCDTLVARITPCLENGKTAYVDFLADGQIGWGSTEYIVLRPFHPLPPEYAYFLARTAEFRDHAIINMTGTSGRQRVPAEAFDRYLVVVPPEPIARTFGSLASTMIASMKQRDQESRTLATLRDTLLPKLISGELRVPEAERLVGKST